MSTTITQPTAAETVQSQHASIIEAISIMQSDADNMTGSIDPETDSWRDASKFAQTAEIARSIISQHAEKKGN